MSSNSLKKHNELTFQLMVDAAPNALILVNQQGKIAFVNSYTEKLFQYERSEIIGQSIEILIPSRFKKNHSSYMGSFFSNPNSRMMGVGRELFAIKKDKSEFPVEIGLNPIVTVDGNLVLASIIDISERKKAEDLFRKVVESAPNAMILVNDKGIIKFINSQTEKLFKYRRDELLGNRIEQLIPKESRANHPTYREEFSKNPEVRSMGAGRDLYGLDRDNNKFPVEIGLNPLETSEGKMVLASVIDITDRKKSENELLTHTQKIENKNKELEQFTYIASHDLQEPLKSISSLTALLKNELEGKLSPDISNTLNFLEESTDRIKVLITALLDYGRIGSKLILETIDCQQVYESVCEDLYYSIQNTNARFIVPEQLPIIIGYKDEIILLFNNLISNAIKFARDETPPLIKITYRKKDNGWEFCISDNGIGFNMRYANKIFAFFQQLHPKNTYSGIGIGLSCSKKIVELHEGQIWAESKENEGSLFYFTLQKN